jgi:hypothetical protein
MGGPITPICSCEETLPIRASCAVYHAYLERARWGQNDRSVARLVGNVLGAASAIEICCGSHWEFWCRATGRRYPREKERTEVIAVVTEKCSLHCISFIFGPVHNLFTSQQ